jgi:hypothetical protein
MKFLFGITVFWLSLTLWSGAASIEIREGAQGLEPLLSAHPQFKEGAVGLVEWPELGKCLAASATAVAEAATPTETSKARSVAELKARRDLVGFFKTKIKAQEKSTTEVITEGEVDRLRETYSSRTESEIEGLVAGSRRVGSWQLTGEPTYGVLLVLPLNAPAIVPPPAPLALPKSAEGDITVLATGRAAYTGNAEVSRAKALTDAMQNAVKEGLGQVIKATESVTDQEGLSSKILAVAEGYVSSHEILSEEIIGQAEMVLKIKAAVTKDRLISDATKIGLLRSQIGNPKVSVIAWESANGEWLDGDNSPLSTMLLGEFVSKNIQAINVRQAMSTMQTQQPEKFRAYQEMIDKMKKSNQVNVDTQLFARLGIASDLLIIGSIAAKNLGKDSDGIMDRYESTVILQAVNAGTAEILATITDSKVAVADNPNSALINVCKKLTPRVRELIPQLVERWQNMLNNGQMIVFAVENLPNRKFGSNLRKALPTMPKVVEAESNQEDGGIRFTVKYKGTPNEFLNAVEAWVDETFGKELQELKQDFEIKNRGGSVVLSFVK